MLAAVGALSIEFVAAIAFSPIGTNYRAFQAVEGVASIGSRAGPLADQMSIRGATVGTRTGTTPPSQNR